MLNSYASTNMKINAVTGMIAKNYRKSWFKQFHLQSRFADTIFCANANTIIVQMMMCGDMVVVAELITAKDLDEALSAQEVT